MDAARLHLDEVIIPHRSLSRGGLALLLGVIIWVNVALAVMFVIMGALPIPVFLGLDVLAICLAFRASNRQTRRRERVQVTADEIRVLREDDKASRTVWTSPTAFTRVLLVEPREDEAYVSLAVMRRRCPIGSALGAEARRSLARRVEDAISSARRERYPC
jgi:uncharacterized membrane protein